MSLRYTKYRLRTRQIKMIGQRKPGRNVPYNLFKLPWGCDLLCLCVYPHKVHSFSLLILASLHSVFVRTLLCKAKGPGPRHWPLVYWLGFSSYCHSPTSVSDQETKPRFKPLQAKANRDGSHLQRVWYSYSGVQFVLWCLDTPGDLKVQPRLITTGLDGHNPVRKNRLSM